MEIAQMAAEFPPLPIDIQGIGNRRQIMRATLTAMRVAAVLLMLAIFSDASFAHEKVKGKDAESAGQHLGVEIQKSTIGESTTSLTVSDVCCSCMQSVLSYVQRQEVFKHQQLKILRSEASDIAIQIEKMSTKIDHLEKHRIDIMTLADELAEINYLFEIEKTHSARLGIKSSELNELEENKRAKEASLNEKTSGGVTASNLEDRLLELKLEVAGRKSLYKLTLRKLDFSRGELASLQEIAFEIHKTISACSKISPK